MIGFDVVTDTQLRLQAAHARATRIIAWAFVPLLLGALALTAWAASPTYAVPVSPVILMCCLVAVGITLALMLSALQDARAAARTLAAAHHGAAGKAVRHDTMVRSGPPRPHRPHLPRPYLPR